MERSLAASQDSLTEDERVSSDAFFASPFGLQMMQMVDSAVVTGTDIVLDLRQLDTGGANAKDIEAFLTSTAGDKLFVQLLYRKGATRQEVRAKSRQVVMQCMGLKAGV